MVGTILVLLTLTIEKEIMIKFSDTICIHRRYIVSMYYCFITNIHTIRIKLFDGCSFDLSYDSKESALDALNIFLTQFNEKEKHD